MSARAGIMLSLLVLGGCQREAVMVATDAEAIAQVERSFDDLCLKPGASALDIEAAAKAADWLPFGSETEGFYYLEPGPEGPKSAGDMALFVDRPVGGSVICDVAIKHTNYVALRKALAEHMMGRADIDARPPTLDGLETSRCFPVGQRRGATISACANDYPDAPAAASLQIEWPSGPPEPQISPETAPQTSSS